MTIGDDGPVTATRPGEVSEREAEVLAALGARLSNAQIANSLHISIRTVESHVSSLLRKYGVTDRRALAAIAGQASAGQASAGQAPPPGQLAGLVGRWPRTGEALLIVDVGDQAALSIFGTAEAFSDLAAVCTAAASSARTGPGATDG